MPGSEAPAPVPQRIMLLVARSRGPEEARFYGVIVPSAGADAPFPGRGRVEAGCEGALESTLEQIGAYAEDERRRPAAWFLSLPGRSKDLSEREPMPDRSLWAGVLAVVATKGYSCHVIDIVPGDARLADLFAYYAGKEALPVLLGRAGSDARRRWPLDGPVHASCVEQDPEPVVGE